MVRIAAADIYLQLNSIRGDVKCSLLYNRYALLYLGAAANGGSTLVVAEIESIYFDSRVAHHVPLSSPFTNSPILDHNFHWFH